MKKATFTLIFICSVMLALGQVNPGFAQGTSEQTNPVPAQTQLPNLNGVTFGFGVGYSYMFNKTYDYSLTTDGNHNLQQQPLSKQSFVISSVIMVKLGKVAVDPTSNTILKQSKKDDYKIFMSNKYNDQIADNDNRISLLKNKLALSPADTSLKTKLADAQSKSKQLKAQKSDATGNPFWGRVSIDASLDLANVSSSVSFNKSVNGGLGVGYFITDNLQAALFYDVSRIRQLRDYVVNNYEGKPIPNGSGTNYNALDTSDNNLFYDRTISGLSFKLIFSLANKASTPSTGE